MNLKFWTWGRSPTQENEGRALFPGLRIEYRPEGDIYAAVTWPQTDDKEKAFAIARDLARTIYLLTTGELNGLLQQAILLAGQGLEEPHVAEMTNHLLGNAFANAGSARNNRPMVMPLAAFGVSNRRDKSE